MLKVYRIVKGRLEAADTGALSTDSTDRFWLDLMNFSSEDKAYVKRARGVSLPDMADLKEIKATSRFFSDDDGTHLRTCFLESCGNRLKAHSVGFIISDDCLISLRSEPIKSFDLLANKRKIGADAEGPMSVFLRLVEIQLDLIADLLEAIYANVDAHWPGPERVGHDFLAAELGHVSRMGADNNKGRFSLMDLELVLAALERENTIPVPLQRQLDAVRRDVDSLLNHSGFLSERLDFLMDSVMMRLNLADNRIGKILSVVALVFLPPTLIGSIYGMNFHHMPELDYSWAYPAALAAMAASAVIPYLLFKWKRWL